jgi:hypothetical protein
MKISLILLLVYSVLLAFQPLDLHFINFFASCGKSESCGKHKTEVARAFRVQSSGKIDLKSFGHLAVESCGNYELGLKQKQSYKDIHEKPSLRSAKNSCSLCLICCARVFLIPDPSAYKPIFEEKQISPGYAQNASSHFNDNLWHPPKFC